MASQPVTLDFPLDDDLSELRTQVRRFAQDVIAPRAAELDRLDQFPRDLWPLLGAQGLLGITVPERWGGAGLGYLAHVLVMEEVSRASGAVGLSYIAHSNLCVNQLRLNGTDDQRDRWLPKLVTGEHVGALAMSESGAGSDVVSMKLRADRDGADYVLNGRKMWITNGPIAQVAVIWAKLDNEVNGFLVEAGTPGFHATPIQRKFAYRTSPTALIRLEDCRIPAENLLPGARGLKSVFRCLNLARWGVACGAVGAAMACYQTARAFALERNVFDRAIGSYQLVQDQLTRMLVEITKAQLVNYHLGRFMDRGAVRPAQISLAKLNNVREAMTIARMARDILGARGILADHHVIRHLCDLEAVSTLEGTASMHTLVLGQEVTGCSAFT